MSPDAAAGADCQMARKRYSAEEVARLVDAVEDAIAGGASVAEACRASGISLNSYYRWRRRNGYNGADPEKRVRELERENERLKRAVADLTVEMLILKEMMLGR